VAYNLGWLASPVVPSWLGAVGQWTNAPNSSLTGSGVGWGGTSPGGGTYVALIQRWSGAVLATDGVFRGGAYVSGGHLVNVGGGHTDYGGNELYAYGPFSSNSPTYVRLLDPTVPGTDGTGGVFRNGSGYPVSRHTYDTPQYIVARKSLLLFGCPARYVDGGNNNSGDLFDFTKNPSSVVPWSNGFDAQITNFPNNGYNRAVSAIDEATGVYWLLGQGGSNNSLVKFDPSTLTSTAFSCSNPNMEDNCAAGFDSVNKILVFGGTTNTILGVDCRNPAGGASVYTISTTGSGPNSFTLALKYDAPNARFVGWNDTGKTLYFLTPSGSPYSGGTAWTWTSTTPAGGDTPGTILFNGNTRANGAMIGGRMRIYDGGSWRGVILQPNETDPICVYRLS